MCALAPVPSVAEAQGGGLGGGGNSEILREALRPKKCVEEASAVAQGRCTRGQCVPTAQGQGRDVQGAFGECVAVSPSLWDLHARAPGPLKLKEHTWGWGLRELGKETQLEVV